MKISLSLLFVFTLALSSCQGLLNENNLGSLGSPHTFSDLTPLYCSNRVSSFHDTKVLFVIDKTFNNRRVDPKGLQIENIKNLVQNNKENIYYGVLAFSKGKVLSPLSTYNVPIFTSDREQVIQALSHLEKQKNAGRVNYSQLFKSIKKALDYDVRMNGKTVIDYHVLFVSGDSLKASEKEKEFFAHQLSEMSTNSPINNVYVHSFYYGENKESSSTKGIVGEIFRKGTNITLQAYLIAQGVWIPVSRVFDQPSEEEEPEDNQHVEFLKSISSSGQYIDQKEFSEWNFKWTKPWKIKHFMVYNVNASECLDGVMGLDSDRDGLCDMDEISMEGFNPQSRFSFKDGYSDAFHFLALSKSFILPDCTDKLDLDHDLLTHCEEQYINSIESSFPPLQVDNPDSDEDGVIDGVETLLFLRTQFLAARDPHNISNSEVNIKEQVALTHPHNDQLQYETELIALKGDQSSCYALKQEIMPVYSENDDYESAGSYENLILVYFLREQQNSNKRIYQFKYEKVQSEESFTTQPFYSSVQDDQLKHYSFSSR